MQVIRASSVWKDIYLWFSAAIHTYLPLLLNIHYYDLLHFLENSDIASYANDNTLYSAEKNKEDSLRV